MKVFAQEADNISHLLRDESEEDNEDSFCY